MCREQDSDRSQEPKGERKQGKIKETETLPSEPSLVACEPGGQRDRLPDSHSKVPGLGSCRQLGGQVGPGQEWLCGGGCAWSTAVADSRGASGAAGQYPPSSHAPSDASRR